MLSHGILALSISTVIFPAMSRQFELGRDTRITSYALQRAFAPPLSYNSSVDRPLHVSREHHSGITPIRILFVELDQLVANALGFFAVGLLAFAVVETVTRAFYAMHDTRTPVIASIITIGANILLSWSFHRGLASAGSR